MIFNSCRVPEIPRVAFTVHKCVTGRPNIAAAGECTEIVKNTDKDDQIPNRHTVH